MPERLSSNKLIILDLIDPPPRTLIIYTLTLYNLSSFPMGKLYVQLDLNMTGEVEIKESNMTEKFVYIN